MAANHRHVQTLPGTMQTYTEKVRAVPYLGLNFTITGEQPIAGGVMFLLNHGMTWKSYGEHIRIVLTAQGNQTGVEIVSECAMPMQLVDMGKNKENVTKLFEYLMQGIAPPSPGVGAARQPLPGGVRFCRNCGRQLGLAAVFCSGCGTKQM